MKNKLNLLEWSLNLRSDKTAKPYQNLNRDIKNLSVQPDIIFLTETVKNNHFEIKGFVKVAESDNIYGNTNSIMIREELIQNKEIEIIKILGKIPNAEFDDSPCFAQVDIKIEEIVYNLIAVRVKIVYGDLSVDEYVQRKKQFEIFMNYINTLENPIIMGDFNHGRILGNEYAESVVIKNTPDFKGCSQCLGDYFYQSIKEAFAENKLLLHTPKKSVSCGIEIKNNTIVTKENPNWNYKIDHLIVNPKQVQVRNISYNWDFLKTALKEKAETFDFDQDVKRKYKKGFPDHAMLLSEIELRSLGKT